MNQQASSDRRKAGDRVTGYKQKQKSPFTDSGCAPPEAEKAKGEKKLSRHARLILDDVYDIWQLEQQFVKVKGMAQFIAQTREDGHGDRQLGRVILRHDERKPQRKVTIFFMDVLIHIFVSAYT